MLAGEVNLGAPLLGGGFVTGRRGKPCSYKHLIVPEGGVSMGRSGYFRGRFWPMRNSAARVSD